MSKHGGNFGFPGKVIHPGSGSSTPRSHSKKLSFLGLNNFGFRYSAHHRGDNFGDPEVDDPTTIQERGLEAGDGRAWKGAVLATWVEYHSPPPHTTERGECVVIAENRTDG